MFDDVVIGRHGDDMSTGAPFPAAGPRHATTADGTGAPVRQGLTGSGAPSAEA
ncbi:hypothetical protein [Streptomyces cinereospinus]|uniref:Uncharacterized protein n=1 Tax=Streptomyces cinereospinus TaxID=285561 RepID=A0ABV5N7W8_9ACTN